MENRNKKYESSNPKMEGDDVKKIDLTLKLGPALQYNQSQEEEEEEEDNDTTSTCRGSQGFFGTASQSSNHITGNWNNNSSSSSGAAKGKEGRSNYSYNYNYNYPPFPHNNPNPNPNPNPNRKRDLDTKACKACGSNSTPLWRKGPDGPQTLCNACGLRHLRTVKRGGE